MTATNIIERLRGIGHHTFSQLLELGTEAADLIEQLRAENFGKAATAGAVKRMIDEIGRLRADYSRLEKVTMAEIGRLRAENNRLREELRKWTPSSS